MTLGFSPAELSMLKVLVVDDEQMMRTMIVNSLNALGLRDIELAINAEEALEKVQMHDDFHLIICDWIMPGMSGLEFLKQIKALKSSSKFLIITGKATSDAVSEAMAVGADSYLTKPFRIQTLHERLNQMIGDIVA